jgi:hypothetical protein
MLQSLRHIDICKEARKVESSRLFFVPSTHPRGIIVFYPQLQTEYKANRMNSRVRNYQEWMHTSTLLFQSLSETCNQIYASLESFPAFLHRFVPLLGRSNVGNLAPEKKSHNATRLNYCLRLK